MKDADKIQLIENGNPTFQPPVQPNTGQNNRLIEQHCHLVNESLVSILHMHLHHMEQFVMTDKADLTKLTESKLISL